MKTRIIKRIRPDGDIRYVIQQPHFIFRWWWVDAWINSSSGSNCNDSWKTLKEAKENLWIFDGSKSQEEIIA